LEAKGDAIEFFTGRSLEYWLETHTLDFSVGPDDQGHERNVLVIGAGELDPELAQWEQTIADLTVPSGMGQFDTAAFTDAHVREKAAIRLRVRALICIKERIKARCLNYLIRLERQLDAQQRPESFLQQVQSKVNNFFKARSEDVYSKLLKASELVGSSSPEDMSLLLTQVRRALKAAADHFYPPSNSAITCSDGKERTLGDDQYLNRLSEFLATRLGKSSSRDLLKAELEHLAVFMRRLNDVASKGVHANVAPSEAKQGLLGVYLLLYNICSRLEENTPA
jgi:hypothetical protein